MRKILKFHLVSIEPSGFQHAGAWYELAELVMHGFLRAGFDCTTSINRVESGRTNIVFGVQHATPEMKPLFPRETIFFNTEQLETLSPDFNHQKYMQIRYWAQQGYRFLDYSRENLAILNAWGAREVMLMPLGYVPELERLARSDSDFDLLFYGGRNDRRNRVLNEIANTGVNLKYLNGVYGADRDRFIEKSKVVLNLHLYESQIFELVRVNYLMHNKVCLLTEINKSTKIEEDLKELFVCSPRERLASAALDLLEQPDVITQKASLAYDWLRSRPQELIIKTIFSQ